MSARPGRAVFSDGLVHVCADLCSTCVFRPGNLMRLAPGRLAGMVADATADQSTIVCHSTLYGQASQELACRGFYDRHPTVPLRLAAALDRVRFVPPPDH